MSRRISLNLELNKRLSRASNYTPSSDRSIDSKNSSFTKAPSATFQPSRLKESLIRTRETLRSRAEQHPAPSSNLGTPPISPRAQALPKPSHCKLQILKYSNFAVRKMQENEYLNTLYIDRLPKGLNIIELIEKDQYDDALLLALQLLSDVIVHCGDYLPESPDIVGNIYQKS